MGFFMFGLWLDYANRELSRIIARLTADVSPLERL